MDRSCQAYDAGDESEAVRIATTLRTLFRDPKKPNPKRQSLLTHLGMTAVPVLSSKTGVPRLGDWTCFVKLKIQIPASNPIRAIPKLNYELIEVPRNTWWEGEPVYVHETTSYFRRDLVGAAADRDGGAHVDADLDAFYVALEAGIQSLSLDGAGLTFDGEPPFDVSKVQSTHNLHKAMLRQFAHEIQMSSQHYNWRLPHWK